MAWLSKDRYGYYLTRSKPFWDAFFGVWACGGHKADLGDKHYPEYGVLARGDCVKVKLVRDDD